MAAWPSGTGERFLSNKFLYDEFLSLKFQRLQWYESLEVTKEIRNRIHLRSRFVARSPPGREAERGRSQGKVSLYA